MSFLNTLNSAGSALGHFNDRLSLIGTNIASTQTPGYDRQRQTSTDSFYQSLSQANAVAGGTASAGGVKSGGIETVFTVGDIVETGQSTDIAIDGRGWFPMQDNATGEFRVSRVGSFKMDGNGFLLDPKGNQLLGIQGQPPAFQVSLDAQNRLLYEVDPTVASATPGETGSVLNLDWQGPKFSSSTLSFSTTAVAGGQTFPATDDGTSLTTSVLNPVTGEPYSLADIEASSPRALGLNVGQDGTVNWQFSNGTTAPAAWLRLAEVRDPSRLEAVGESLFAINDASNLVGDWQTNAPGENGRGDLVGGSLEMSNVDITTEFADMMASQRSYQASSKMLSVMDELLSSVTRLRR